MSFFPPSKRMLEVAIDCNYNLQMEKFIKLTDQELEVFKQVMVKIANRAAEEQAVRRLKAAPTVPEVTSGDKGS